MSINTVCVTAYGRDWHVREGVNDDLNVVAEVYGVDCYRLREMLATGFSPRVILDIGGHLGSFSVLAHTLWPEAAIYVVEPNPISHDLLRQNAPFAHRLQAAVRYDNANLLADGGPATGSGFMTTRGEFDAKAEIKHRQDGYEYQIVHHDVELMTLEAILEHFGIEHIDLLKLDCEGSEVHLLENLSSPTAARIGSVVGEYHMEGGFAAFKALAERTLPHLELYGGNGQEIGPFWSRSRVHVTATGSSTREQNGTTFQPRPFRLAISLPALHHLYRNQVQLPVNNAYLRRVLAFCPRGGRACEVVPRPAMEYGPYGLSGWSTLWLAHRGVVSQAVTPQAVLLEELRQLGAREEVPVHLEQADILHLYREDGPRFDLIHHSDVLALYTVPEIQALLAQQVAMADRVVFRVPSMYHTDETGQASQRLLPLEEWQRILEPFEVLELSYCGETPTSQSSADETSPEGRSHIFGVLRGQAVTPQLLAMMEVPEEPFAPGISAIVHTRNEARRIADCLESLRGWADQIIVCDMESEDETVEIASRYTEDIVYHCRIPNFDQARNAAAMRARHRWVFYLDADERVPAALGHSLRAMADRQLGALPEERFAAMAIPFRHHFAGRWMQSMYPGYTSPRLFKNGKFFFRPRLHAGADVDGPVVRYPEDDPNSAIVHYSYDNIAHYLQKMGHYTDGEALNMHQDGRLFSWQALIEDFVEAAQLNYDGLQGAQKDSVHGFLYAFLSGFYRLVQHGKLFEKHFMEGRLQPEETMIPPRLDQVLEYALQVARREHQSSETALLAQESHINIVRADTSAPDAASFVWSGPLLSSSGYGEHSRSHLFDLQAGGLNFAAQILPWRDAETDLKPEERELLAQIAQRPVSPGFVHLVHGFPHAFHRHPQAGISIGRTVFETDRLPAEWVMQCNQMDYIWVTSEFSRRAFAASGVAPEKLRVFPEIFNANDFQEPTVSPYLQRFKDAGKFVFLGVFEWTWKKGWDVLLRAFHDAFRDRDDAVLVLKVWSTLLPNEEAIRQQAAQWAQENLGWDILGDTRIHFIQEQLPRAEVHALLWSCDAFVLATHGEGWGRTCMEAMACARPVIATNWSSITEYLTAENGYPIGYELVPVSEDGWRQVPLFKGHRWAQPHHDELVAALRRVVAEPEEAAAKGQRAREEVLAKYTGGRVARQMWEEIERVLGTPASTSVALSSSDENAVDAPEQVAPRPEANEINEAVPVASAPSPSTEANVRDAGVPTPVPSSPIRVRWEGEFFAWHSFGLINRELGLRLLDCPDCELSLIPGGQPWFDQQVDPRFARLASRFWAPLSAPAEVHVRHIYPPNLDAPPPEGKFVLIQPWEYGYLPTDWVEPILSHVDEVWCMSRYVRDVFANSGIPEERLQIVPWGVREDVLHPGALPHVFTDEPGAHILAGDPGVRGNRERFVFLFVGGTLERKGIDILLEAYALAFSALDDVCLVIKDTGTKTVYSGDNAGERIRSLIGDKKHPSIVYIDNEVSDFELAGVYNACDCYVQPYRGEGFCLPVLEAMACGLPAIVPEGGPTDDFVDEEVGWRVPAAHRPYGTIVQGTDGRTRGRIANMECAGPTWTFEVEVEQLARLMRRVVANRDEVRLKGEAAALRVHEHWTWKHTADRIQERLEAFREAPPLAAPHANGHKRIPLDVPKSSTKSAGKALIDNSALQAAGSEPLHIWVPPAYLERTTAHPAASPSVRPEPTISLCMIVRDEERVLGACLESAKAWFDEIIVVDTGSKDSTVEIAERHGAKVHYFPWCDDFSAARNVSLEHATGDWVFWMDADDTLPPECGRKLRDLAATAEDRVTGFIAQVHIPAAPGQTGFTIVDHVKLFRNHPKLRFIGRIHEQILEPIHEAGGRIERSDVFVVHSGYDYSPEGQQKKRQRDLTILEKDLADRPDHPFVLFNIGMTAYHMKEYQKAEQALQDCLERSGPRDSTIRKVYAMLTGCRLESQDIAGAISWVEQGLALYPRDPELLFRAGIIYREAGDLPRAEQSYVTLLTAAESGHIDSLDVTMTGFKARYNLALVLRDMGRPHDAREQFRIAVQQNPEFAPSWVGLGETAFAVGEWDEVQRIARHLETFAPSESQYLRQQLANNLTGAGTRP